MSVHNEIPGPLREFCTACKRRTRGARERDYARESAATPTNRRWETAASYRLQTKRWILRPRDVLSMILVSVLSSELCSSVSKQAQLRVCGRDTGPLLPLSFIQL